MLHPVTIDGGDFQVDSEAYAPFARSLVYVFRNAVDHGLEIPDERLEQGTDASGTLRCEVACEEDVIRLRIEDDGRGIDAERLRR